MKDREMSGHDMSGDMKMDETPAHDAKNEKSKTDVSPMTIYTCPMHPEVRQDRPGKCPKCGMKLVPEAKPPAAGEQGGHP
jgi:hypothetical protein